MNRRAKKLIAGMMLGDGYCNFNTLYVIHGPKQEEYVNWKINLLTSLGVKNIKLIQRDVHTTASNYKQIGFSVSHPYIGWVRKRLYDGRKKIISYKFLSHLSNEAIAIWHMDDGSLYAKKRNGVEHTKELVVSSCCSEKEAVEIIQFFQERYLVKMTIKRKKEYCSVRCGKINAKLIIPKIKPFSCPSMNYKFLI